MLVNNKIKFILGLYARNNYISSFINDYKLYMGNIIFDFNME